MLERCLSKLLNVISGVPQGSLLGPLLYTLFINELPEVIHDSIAQQEPEFNVLGCPAYQVEGGVHGDICCYADDTTLSMSDTNPSTLSANLSSKYKMIAQFMADNKLKLNDEKTHLLVMSPSQTTDQVRIVTSTGIISPTSCEKLLGCHISKDMAWSEHIKGNKDNLLKALNTRLGAVRKIRYLASFKNRKMIAEGIFMSKLTYLIALWGGCGVGLRKSLQSIQNKTAQAVTRCDWSVSSKELLRQCGWMSVNQLIFYHSVLLVFKVKQSKHPRYMYMMHNSWSYPYCTRQAETGNIRVLNKPKLELS